MNDTEKLKRVLRSARRDLLLENNADAVAAIIDLEERLVDLATRIALIERRLANVNLPQLHDHEIDEVIHATKTALS